LNNSFPIIISLKVLYLIFLLNIHVRFSRNSTICFPQSLFDIVNEKNFKIFYIFKMQIVRILFSLSSHKFWHWQNSIEGYSIKINQSLISINYCIIFLETLYLEATCARSFASWFSIRGTCWTLIELKRFNNELAITKYIIKLSLMHLYSFINLFTIIPSLLIFWHFFPPILNIISSPAIKASYSTSLLEKKPLILNLNFVGMLKLEIISIPTPLPFLWLEPSN